MPAYLLVDITVDDSAVYEEYKKLAPSSITRYGGRYIARGGTTEVLEGAWVPSRLVILEFPTMDQARAWWSSAEYAEAKLMRQRSSTTNMVLLEGLASPIG
jgi:uncharacterized protein (DUF1330 family)